MVTLGDAIRRARERRRWTQKQLAAELGVNVKTIDNWENGRTFPKNRLGALEEVLNVRLGNVPTAREHLADQMKIRLQQLGMEWDDLPARADVRYYVLDDLDGAFIERLLKWTPGSVDAIAAGGEPTPLPRAEDDPDRLDRLYREWKEDDERRPVLEAFLESWRGSSAG